MNRIIRRLYWGMLTRSFENSDSVATAVNVLLLIAMFRYFEPGKSNTGSCSPRPSCKWYTTQHEKGHFQMREEA
jgi:hypothetical protein